MPASQTLTLTNDLAEISRLAEAIDAFCAPLAPSDKDLAALHLVLEELVTNVIRHGFNDGAQHLFTVSLKAGDGAVEAVITDDAAAYDPFGRAEVDTSLPLEERPIGGLGVHLVKKLARAVAYERRDGRNIATVICALRPTA